MHSKLPVTRIIENSFLMKKNNNKYNTNNESSNKKERESLWVKLKAKGILQTKPNQSTDDYSSSHLNKGDDYQYRFHQYPGRKLVWNLEKKVLKKILDKKGRCKKHLDFAGGTGRIARIIENNCDEQIVLDISPKMLEFARKSLTKAKLICKDFNDNIPELKDGEYDLITAFRFFPNAEQKLRESAMNFIACKLSKGGWLICNNHRNFWSVPYIVNRLMLIGGDKGMSNNAMIKLAKQNGLTLVSSFSMGVVPQTETKTILPWKITGKIETIILKVLGKMHRRGYNTIYIFEKK